MQRISILMAVCILVATGCAGQFQALSSPQIGCSPDDIDIDNDYTARDAKVHWDAKCNRKKYHCTQAGSVVTCQYFTGQLQALSSPQIGCAPDDIDIDNKRQVVDKVEWEAQCNSKKYRCTQADGVVTCRDFRERGRNAERTVGHVGCLPEEIETDEGSMTMWKAFCRGRVFQCSWQTQEVSCSEILPPPGMQPPPPGMQPLPQ